MAGQLNAMPHLWSPVWENKSKIKTFSKYDFGLKVKPQKDHFTIFNSRKAESTSKSRQFSCIVLVTEHAMTFLLKTPLTFPRELFVFRLFCRFSLSPWRSLCVCNYERLREEQGRGRENEKQIDKRQKDASKTVLGQKEKVKKKRGIFQTMNFRSTS